MIEDDHQPKGVQRDKLDQFRTRSQREVVSNLIELSRTVEPLTILFDSGKQSFPTSIIDVISENTEVVMERASSEEMNKKLLTHEKGTVIGQPGGIKIRFILEKIYAAEHKGDKVFVAPLPQEHYRMQRRRLFRIDTPFRNPVTVTLTLPNEEVANLTVRNISSGGLRLEDVDHVLKCEAKQLLTGCSIKIPDVEPFLTDLEVRNSYEKTKKDGKLVHYIGCSFVDLRANHEQDIQNYINNLQRALRAIAK